MKVLIDIPRELVGDYDTDKFHDCFMRFLTDAKYNDGLAGNYEAEILAMLDEAFNKSKAIDSDPVFFEWNELYWEEELEPYLDDDGEILEDYKWVKYMEKYPEDGELVAIRTEDGKIDYTIYDGYDFGSYDREEIKAWAELKGDN